MPGQRRVARLESMVSLRPLRAAPLGLCALLLACSAGTPQLERLYRTTGQLPDQPPVILLHGAFGGRLR